ncbi:MAG: DUF58 domain-containing protein [Streptosporangiales bacterium]|nr:DUF58 domain-containing protein [Streptosporangiales bacterium]
MRRLLESLTTRGRWFAAAGAVLALAGLLVPEPDLLRLGALLLLLPGVSAFGASRARFRLSCSRRAAPPRVQAGQEASLTLTLANPARLRTGLLLAQDTLPRVFGDPPRFVLDGLRAGGTRTIRYRVRAPVRGKYSAGPLRIQVADAFGLVAITRSFASVSALTVTPRIVPLPGPPPGGNWLGDRETGRPGLAAGGEDDVVPRQYQTGDGLRRVHWRSTARHGQLMVRREEQHWRDTTSLFLDTRRSAFGSGPVFELAVTAAASVGVRLDGPGADPRLVTDGGEIPRQVSFRDTLLEALAVIRPCHSRELGPGIEALSASGGQVIAILGALSEPDARRLAAVRHGSAPALALVLGGFGGPASGILARAGWRVAAAAGEEALPSAWRDLRAGARGDGPDRDLVGG